jgi:sec-independent protein translocase protein TatB
VFDIGFWEIILISVLGLVVLGPERLPVAIRTVSKFIGSAKAMANSVKDELAHELKVQELHDNLKKAEQMGMEELSPELKESVEKLKEAAKSVQQPYSKEPEVKESEVNASAESDKASAPADKPSN